MLKKGHGHMPFLNGPAPCQRSHMGCEGPAHDLPGRSCHSALKRCTSCSTRRLSQEAKDVTVSRWIRIFIEVSQVESKRYIQGCSDIRVLQVSSQNQRFEQSSNDLFEAQISKFRHRHQNAECNCTKRLTGDKLDGTYWENGQTKA